ncbi:hypothetical protein [Thermoflexus sp.]|uniref:hypothetical protein n=1 Tax=Thermoflexus sp. TaxID=1969742 RepID=UPI0025EF05D6|nr:hypothetical protein [Thermoflexus sp.]MDW8064287.1 hypothetical protein [Anaerolineae bacterium]MCS6963360.1 hypothetical protein [Thermoflexus sp.]MCS7351802.1 hypothetical protein [Thermoflexus sp.]MCX7691639.1 hypothetical protein [Thermoflexus sp.]MDW8181261.1 hypothetical protein [Anaerolineae bacterium]
MSLVCRNCGIEIEWQPVIVDRQPYCCLGCAQGGPCQCDYDRLPSQSTPATLAQRTPPPSLEVLIRRPAPLVEAIDPFGEELLNPEREVSDG